MLILAIALIEESLSVTLPQTEESQYPNQNEFRYHFEERERSLERSSVLKKAKENSENNLPDALSKIDDSFLEQSQLSLFLMAYCLLSGKGIQKDEEKAKEYFERGYKGYMESIKPDILRNDLPGYIPYFNAGDSDQFINPYGYVFNEEDMKLYIKEMEKQAEYNIPNAIMFLAYGYLGKFRYFPKDISKAKEYFYQARSLGMAEGSLHLGVIFHDGLDDGIVDLEKAKSYMEEAVKNLDNVNLYLALYAIEDDKDINKAVEYLTLYADIEQESDLGLMNNYPLEKLTEDDDPMIKVYLKQSHDGILMDKEGKEAYLKGDYVKAKECFEKGAAVNEMTEAAAHMAILYLLGKGVEQSTPTAITIIKEIIYTDVM